MSPIEASGLSLTIPEQLTGVSEGRSAFEPATETGFGDILAEALSSANQSANTASHAAKEFAAGSRDDIHGTMLALSKADIELHLVGTVRNKVMDAFYELWRMQI
jgi:flagellar hook-basal body complex protein FliE